MRFQKIGVYDATLKKPGLKRGRLAMAARIIKTLRSWSEGVCIKLNSQGPRKILHPSHAFEVQIFWNFEASLIDPEGENPFPLDS